METTPETSPAGDTPAPAPAADPAAVVDPAAPNAATPEQAPTSDAPAGDAPAAEAKPNGKAKEPKEPEPSKGPNVTARLAKLSTDNREARKALRASEAAREAAEKRAGDFEALVAKAQAGDDSAIDEVFERFGLNFQRTVNYYASKGDEPSPEQKRDQEIADLRKKFEAVEKAREDEVKTRAAAAAEAQRLEYIGGIEQAIKKEAERYPISARISSEAAEKALDKIAAAWNKAGRPVLDPGEYEDAVEKALEVVELEYVADIEKKTGSKPNGKTNGHAANGTNGAAKPSELPANLTGGKLSDTDEAIITGLIDKTAPGTSSQRAKPRTINSSLGGSAPPKQPATGAMDPREALRQVLAPFQRQ